MNKLAHILLIIVSISSILSWAVIAYLWSDQQRLVATIEQLQVNQDELDISQANEQVAQNSDLIIDLQNRVDLLESASGSADTKAVASRTVILPENQVNEYFVSMGSGQSTNNNWVDLDGTAVWIDSAKYSSVQAVYFEGNLAIKGGEVHARLKNKSTGAILAITEIKNNTQNSISKASPAFQLHPGNNEYIVQLRSSSSELASIEGARIRIVIK